MANSRVTALTDVKQKTTTGAGKETVDLREAHGNLQEGPNCNRQTKQADRRDEQPSGNERCRRKRKVAGVYIKALTTC
jgi:hypothetical protein